MRRPFPFRRVCLFVPPQSSITNVFDPASSDVPPQSSYKRHPSKPRTPETHSRDTARCDTIIIIYIEETQNQGSRCTSSALFHLPFFLSIHFLPLSLSLVHFPRPGARAAHVFVAFSVWCYHSSSYIPVCDAMRLLSTSAATTGCRKVPWPPVRRSLRCLSACMHHD